MSQTKFILVLLAFAVFSMPGLASAKSADDVDASALSGLAPMTSNDLSGYAGGSFNVTTVDNSVNVTNTATTDSTVSDNTIGAVAGTGSISNINVLGNSGLTSAITNTGNQVSISQATAINITLH